MGTQSRIMGLTYEQEVTFGTNPASSPTRVFLADMPKFTLGQELLGQDILNMEIADLQSVIGAQSGELTFSARVRGNGTAAGPSVPMAATDLSPLLEGCGLKPVIASYKNGATVQAGGGASTFIGATGEGANWDPDGSIAGGQAVISKLNGSNRAEFNVAASVSVETVTVARAWTAQPTAGDAIYNTRSVFPAVDADDLVTHLKTFSFTIYRDDAKFVLSGGAGTFTVKTDARGLLVIEFKFMIDNWSVAASASPAVTLDNATRAIVCIGSPGYIADAAVTLAGWELDLGNEIQEQPAVGSTNGRAGWVITGRKTRIKLRSYFSTARLAYWSAGTLIEIMASAGTTAGTPGVFGFYMPQAEVLEPGMAEINGQNALELVCRPIQQTRTVWPGDTIIAWG